MTEAPGEQRGPVLQAADLPLDPDDIQTQTAFGPAFVRDDAPLDDGGEEELSEEEEAEQQVLADLDESAREDFVGLMRLGYLEDTCTIAGHRFRLRTPSHDAKIERGNLHRPSLNSMNVEPVWRLITVAAYLIEIDDVPSPEPLNARSTGVSDRLRWVKETIYSQVLIEKLYIETLRLDARERAVVDYLDGQAKD